MRGGVDSSELFYNTDISDLEIMDKIVEENIEATKKTQLPMV